MKTKLLFLGLLITIQSFSQIVTIPDANFKTYLLGNTSINTNGNTEIEYSEASSFTGIINCSSRSISDLTGIEAFVKLTILDCNDNQLTTLNTTNNPDLFLIKCDRNLLTSLDFTNNPRLSGLNCNSNQITSLNVSNNIQLSALNCYGNQISNIDVTNNIHLTHLNLNSNQLTSLDVSNNLSLSSLICNYNQLTALDVSSNTMLKGLNCGNNLLTTLDVSNNSLLETVFCSFNQIIDLDFSTNSALTKLRCNGNQLTSLNVKNGNNLNVDNRFFRIDDNPNLTCVEVDIANYSTTNWVVKDAQTSYSINCSSCIVYIPDVNFKNAVLNHTPIIDTNNDGEIQCSEALAVTGVLNVANKGIVDTTGLEAFVNITRLAMFNNAITSIDLSSNTLLTQLLLESNQLTTIDISILSLLTDFKAHSNLFTSANVANGNNSNMWRMQLQGNSSLTCIQIDQGFTPPTNNSWLKDATANYSFNCGPCIVNIPDVNFKNAVLNHTPIIDTNNDGEIQCSEALAVTGVLNVSGKGIVDTTGLEAFVNITRLAMFNNAITNIDLSSNTLLTQLLLESNQLTTIDISMLSLLTDFKAHSNSLTSVNIANGNNSNMWRMQLQGNPSLTCIKIDQGFTPPTNNSWIIDTTANYSTSCPQYPVANPNANISLNILQRNNSNLVVYPNPTSNTISVKGIDSIEKLSLFTVGGDKLISRDKTNEMNISKLGKGIYWLIIETKGEVIKKKIIKE